ncbi:MAG: tyrosine-type recombinase/integrase, partial [Gammaproteobacteria bacterium]|nr:tyrosine-type recombinase/integrase [Gammaproteobacteria bacterium]
MRPREHLTEAEVEALIKAAGAAGRHRERDRTLILVAYTHGLRVSELISLQWSQVD